MPKKPFSICVYCGSRPGVRPEYTTAAENIGTLIGARGWQLVYGGGGVGLMGTVADAVLATGGRVIGVIPESLKQREVEHRKLTELHVVSTMHVRKQMMAERADAFVALPGGIGTLEELFEVWTWAQLGYHDRPIGVLDAAGYFARLLGFLDHSVEQGFLDRSRRDSLIVDSDATRLLDRLKTTFEPRSDDFSRI